MDFTRLLSLVQEGDESAKSDLLSMVYDELRLIAASRLRQESPGQTLQPTALVHEVWIRIAGAGGTSWDSRGHFFGAAAEAMRRILIDNARRKKRLKRGGGDANRTPLVEEHLATDKTDIGEELLDLNEALEKFEQLEPAKSQVVKLKFFVGLTNREVGAAIGISEATVERYWSYARAWLVHHMRATPQL